MAEDKTGSNGAKAEEQASAGDKHQTEHEEPQSKRAKTEKQTTLDDQVVRDGDEAKYPDGGENGDAGEEVKSDENKDGVEGEGEDTQKPAVEGEGEAEHPGEEQDIPSSIQEKGIIYFFIRGRVNIEDPHQVDDVARTYMLLRPLAKDAKLGSGTLADGGNTRLLALPKKTLPKSGRDRFMVFVEKSGATFAEIKDEFLKGEDYDTKTAGTRHTPAATPVGEGVYAVTSTGRDSHLAYMLTLPEELGSAQEKLGLKEKGSFILSTKNPEYPGPQNAQLPEGPGFSKEIMDEFRSLRWMPTKPTHLDYPNAQVLFIGESDGIDNAVEIQDEDQKKGKQEPVEVLEHLEEEDLKRMKDLPGKDSEAVFADLRAQAEGYPKLKTTF